MNAFGAHVTLLETAPNILPPADADVARALRDGFERQGVRVVTGISGIEGIELEPDGLRRLTYLSQGVQYSIVVEAVILAVGWPAALEGLGLEQIGLETERGFIKINSFLQTNFEHIFVAGDANGLDMLVQGANFEAEVAAENAVRGAKLEFDRHSLPSGGFTDPDHAGVGVQEARARDEGIDCVVAVARYSDLERAIIDSRTAGFLKLIADSDGRIIGANGTGENAVEVMQAVATAMAAQATAATLASVRFAYPTYTAIIGEAARKILTKLEARA